VVHEVHAVALSEQLAQALSQAVDTRSVILPHFHSGHLLIQSQKKIISTGETITFSAARTRFTLFYHNLDKFHLIMFHTFHPGKGKCTLIPLENIHLYSSFVRQFPLQFLHFLSALSLYLPIGQS
jgi:hypothetical protein